MADALHSLGFSDVVSVHVGRHLVLDIDSENEAAARDATSRMCAQLLANPVTEDFEVASVTAT